MKRSKSLIYIIIVIVILAIPSVGMIFAKSEWSTETTSLAEAPEITDEEGNLNIHYLSDAGRYFEDYFFGRPQLITADSLIRKTVFSTSANQKIIIGKEGWYFYQGEMPDYQGTGSASDRQLINITHNLKLTKDYLEILGIDLVFTVAPDKSTLYSQYMPSYMIKSSITCNAKRLAPMLEEAGIHYADLFSAFEANDEVLYFKEDTHWNNLGALLAYETIMDTLSSSSGKHADRKEYNADSFEPEKDHSGDLAEMLTPEAVIPETDYYCGDFSFSYLSDTKDNMDDLIETECADGTGDLYMFRDSFGASLLPYFANEFENAVFSRLVPYSLAGAVISGADTVIIERAERNLSSLSEEPPLLAAPETAMPGELTETASDTKADLSEEGAYTVVEGTIDPRYFSDDTEILILIHDSSTDTVTAYIPFYISGTGEEAEEQPYDNGFRACFLTDAFSGSELSYEIAAISDAGQYSLLTIS